MPGDFSSTVISLFHSKRAQATEQGGLLSGTDPTEFNERDPIRLWIVQVGIIVLTTQLLSLALRKMRQPKVIAEVLGGILLGAPRSLGRVPGFTDHIFPQQSIPYLTLVANIGLCLFLFLVGLEIDGAVIRRNARLSTIVALAGMILPFGLGAALSIPLYKEFVDENVKFTHFMLFTGVAYSITAFPVLCRILTELKLLDTTVGIVVLSAGVGNDVIGWVLLALSVALVNAGSGLTALYILLVCVGWTVFLVVPVKYALRWVARKTGSLENGPTMFFMTVTIVLVFGSAFFTDIIGVHAIFGAFIVGLIVPRDGGLAIALTEKLEDMVSIIFLPLYFTLSGLNTNLGLLDDGITWGYTIAICALAFIGKFGGCTLASKYIAGFNWRESTTIGSLMSCKGLVELIVLNVGLSAHILSPKVFSMFVLEALLLTFMTTPLVTTLYPPQYRVRVAATGPNFNNVADDEQAQRPRRATSRLSDNSKMSFTVVLDKIQHVPGMMSLVQLLQPAIPSTKSDAETSSQTGKVRRSLSGSLASHEEQKLHVDALRILELSDRTSAVMMSSAHNTLLQTDPVLAIFKTFGQLHDIPITTSISIVPFDDLSYSVAEHARNHGSDMIMLPWLPPSAITDHHNVPPEAQTPKAQSHSNNPFDALFKPNSVSTERSESIIHSQLVRGVFAQSTIDVALFIDQGNPNNHSKSSRHLFLPFFGGPDDRLALDFVVRLCANPKVTASVVRLTKMDVERPAALAPVHTSKEMEEVNAITVASAVAGIPDTVYGRADTEVRLQSDTADNIAWSRYTKPQGDDVHNAALSQIQFTELATPVPLHAMLSQVHALRDDVMLVTGRSRRLAVENHSLELKDIMEEHGVIGTEVKKAIGDVATACVSVGCGSAVIVVQAATA
ncbi:hypothetical protein PLEOSDRAFT_1062891 [Pleurotus ostreatus PC15]|uniref:Cation/H+ exchanger transmembrane domain-containing protein n=1 Tax=Pleurotus ostreatus (strain PC15) TaxID=1137138 RepID=A0A067P3D4_PLEO1|nr:hypothetical protein PLEOSDRAFT_1062891 [Pleurotus ostreatus PC15]